MANAYFLDVLSEYNIRSRFDRAHQTASLTLYISFIALSDKIIKKTYVKKKLR